MTVFKEHLKKHLEQSIPQRELERWFDPLCLTPDNDRITLRVSFPHAFFGQHFMDCFRKPFEAQLLALVPGIRILYDNGALSPPLPVGPGRKETEAFRSAFPPAQKGLPLLERYRFDSFIANRKNDFPLAVAHEAVSGARSWQATPLVLYGQSGAGKSHLLCAMAHALRETCPERSLYYGGPEYLETLSPTELPREQAVLLDDIQRAYHTPELRERLSALIDAFVASNRLLVLCADAHPANAAQRDAKLLSRLTSGLVVEMKQPDLDVRRQYLQQQNSRQGLGLGKEHILTLAQRHHDIRTLNGLLLRITTYRSLIHRHEGDIDSIFEHSFGDNPDQPLLRPEAILKTVAGHFSCGVEDLVGKKRGNTLSLARSCAMLLCRELLGLSLMQVGAVFGGRDHSSILYSLKKIKALQDSDKDVHTRVAALKQLCLTSPDSILPVPISKKGTDPGVRNVPIKIKKNAELS